MKDDLKKIQIRKKGLLGFKYWSWMFTKYARYLNSQSEIWSLWQIRWLFRGNTFICDTLPSFTIFHVLWVFSISGLAEHLTLLRFSRQINSMSIRGVYYAHHMCNGAGMSPFIFLYFPPGLYLGCLTAEPWFVAKSRTKLPTKKCELCQCRSPHK